MAKITQAANLSPTQVHVLKLLTRFPNGLTRSQMERELGLTVGTDTTGPIYEDKLHEYPESLYGKDHIYPVMGEDDDTTRWVITKSGKRMAEKVRTRILSFSVVPGEILDPVVMAFRPTRTYGIELYSNDDIEEIKGKLGDGYKDVDTDSLRQQIVNRRKMGKYKTAHVMPEWYTIYRQGQHWTALVQEVTEHNGCAVNNSHDGGINVYHRRFRRTGESVINREIPKDLIVLCESCRKKLSGSLPSIPERQ